MALTPEQIGQKWSRNAQSASQSYVEGVQAVTVAPGQKAAAQKQTYLANVQAAADKWAARVAGVGLEEWRAKTVAKGRARYGPGIAAGESSYTSFMREFQPHIQQVQSELEGMPRGGLQENIARAVHVMTRNAEFSRTR